MKTYYIAQRTLLNVLWWPNGKEMQKRGNLCKNIADSLSSRNYHNIVKQLYSSKN